MIFLSSLKFTQMLEFIHLISSEANEICEQESKKTIAPEHIIGALKVCICDRLHPRLTVLQRLGFDSFTAEVEDVLKDHKQQQKVRKVRTKTQHIMDCVSGPGEEGRQDKRFGSIARRTHGKARRTFRRKSCKI